MIQIQLPSKTFLLGEYVALNGAPCLVLNTPPYFSLTAEKKNSDVHGIPENSPADLFIKKNKNFFEQFSLNFYDPHQGRGGFGASSAQFLALYLLKNGNRRDEIDIQQLLNDYLECAWDQKGIPPSGADVIGQLTGEITYFEKNTWYVEQITWPFTDYSFLLIPTGRKIPTHKHLLSIKKSELLDLPNLAPIAKDHLLKKNIIGFADCIKQFRSALQEKKFVIDETQQLLEEIDKIPGVLASKGCGALGVDVIFVLCEDETEIRQWCLHSGLNMV